MARYRTNGALDTAFSGDGVVLSHFNGADKFRGSALAIDSDKATSLLLRLLDNAVIELETEGALSIENTYSVIAELANLNLE